MSSHAAKKATNWLSAIYFSEIGWLGATYLMFEVPEGPLKPPEFSFKGWFNRVRARWFRPRAPAPPQPNRIYWSYSFVFFVRSVLNVVGFALLLGDTPDISSTVPKDSRYADPGRTSLTPTETLEVYGSAMSTSRAAVGGWLLFASTMIHFVAYTHHKRLLERVLETGGPDSLPVDIWPRLYTIAHLGLFNFSLDIPGWTVPSTQPSRWLCTVLNLTAGLVLLFCVFVEQPFERAWGCYSPKTSIESYKYGLCPAFFSTDATFSPVCDTPGVKCGEGLIRDREVFRHALAISQMIVSVSFVIYILSIQEKVDYFRLATAQAKAVVSSTKDKDA